MPGAHKIGAAISDPRITGGKITDITLSLIRGRAATQRSKKAYEKVLARVLGKGSQKGSEQGACYGFYSKKGF